MHSKDGRCEFTFGAGKCPGVGLQRVGRKWWCEPHAIWRRQKGSQSDGRAIMEEVQAAHAQARSELSSRPTLELGAGVPCASADEALASCHRMCDTQRAAGWVPWHQEEQTDPALEALEERVLDGYRSRRKALEDGGVARKRAHEVALVQVVFEALVWRWMWWRRSWEDARMPGGSPGVTQTSEEGVANAGS